MLKYEKIKKGDSMKCNKPVIGITVNGGKNLSLGLADEKAIVAAGGIPLLLPIHIEEDDAKRLIGLCDGIMFTGGEDINPKMMGEEMIPQCGFADDERDKAEKAYFKYAREKHIPISGICRGHQVINVFMGGTLYQDITTQCQRENAIQHRSPRAVDDIMHTVKVEKGSLLKKVVGCDFMEVTSTHHQAIKTPAPGLKVTATAPDGIIEALESTDGDYILTVQFHPELRYDKEDYALNIFKGLVNAAENNK